MAAFLDALRERLAGVLRGRLPGADIHPPLHTPARGAALRLDRNS